MKYRISKTAIMGPSFYFMRVLSLFPFSFYKPYSQAPFQISRMNVGLNVLVMIVKLIWVGWFYVSKLPEKVNNVVEMAIPHVFTLIICRESILNHLNCIYSLLKRTKHPLKIFWLLVKVFFSFLISLLIQYMACFSTTGMTGLYASTEELILDQICHVISLSFLSTITCMCAASTLVLNDVYQQLEALRHLDKPDFSDKLLRLAKLQWEAYQNAESISVTFGPYLMPYMLNFLSWCVMYILMNDTYNVIIIQVLSHGFRVFFLCLASQTLQDRCSQMLLLTQEMSLETVASSAADHKVLTLMMKVAASRDLRIQIPNICKFDLHFFVPLLHVAFTYTIIMVQMY